MWVWTGTSGNGPSEGPVGSQSEVPGDSRGSGNLRCTIPCVEGGKTDLQSGGLEERETRRGGWVRCVLTTEEQEVQIRLGDEGKSYRGFWVPTQGLEQDLHHVTSGTVPTGKRTDGGDGGRSSDELES